MTIIKTAKIYRDKFGFSVIPLKPDKRPYIKWEAFQKRKATDEELESWFGIKGGAKFPNVMIGIVTGEISGVAVVDFDTKDIEKELHQASKTPIVSTPRGYHFYFKYKDGITNTAHIGGKPIDVRGEGGYVVAPPSVTKEGKKWEWLTSFNICEPQKFPLEIFSQTGEALDTQEPRAKANYDIQKLVQFEEGARDATFFNIACNLVRGGMQEDMIREVLKQLWESLPPSDEPFTLKEAMQKVDSALKADGKEDKNWANEVANWVNVTHGWFDNVSCYNDLGAKTSKDKSAIRTAMRRLVENEVILPHTSRNGRHRLIKAELVKLDWENAPTDEIQLIFPLDIHDHVKIYPKSTIILAGESNAGKTAFLLDFYRLNQDKHRIWYFNSEMGETEFKIRLNAFEDTKWNMNAYELDDDLHCADVIRPNDINIIDYIDVTDDFWKIATVIKAVHDKLDQGVAILAIQKSPGYFHPKTGDFIEQNYGVGGVKSLGKCRLYLAMGHGVIKFVKVKSWKGLENPKDKKLRFKLYGGWMFAPDGAWSKDGGKNESEKYED